MRESPLVACRDTFPSLKGLIMPCKVVAIPNSSCGEGEEGGGGFRVYMEPLHTPNVGW